LGIGGRKFEGIFKKRYTHCPACIPSQKSNSHLGTDVIHILKYGYYKNIGNRYVGLHINFV